MKVKFLEGLSTPVITYAKGDEVEIDDAEAARLIKGGIAHQVGAKPSPLPNPAAVKPEAQTMDAKTGKPLESVTAAKPAHVGTGDAGPVQSVASVQAAETTAKKSATK